MPYKIAITGEFRRGKDTLASLIASELSNQGIGSLRVAFATELKHEVAEMVSRYTGKRWDDPMLYDRALNGQAWQWWGEFRRKTSGEDYWVVGLQRTWFDEGRKSNIIITDMRHHNEAKWCRDNGFYLIRITGPRRTECEQRDPGHPSEVHVAELPVHLEIQNTGGLDTLREKVSSELMPKIKEFFDARVPG